MEVNEPITEYGKLDLEKSYTYLDYLNWKFKERVELIKGKIFKMSPAPHWMHQKASQSLNKVIYNFFTNRRCEVFYAPIDVKLPIASHKGDTVVQPDICVVCDLTKLDDHGIVGAPDLIVEILSESNKKHDLETKFNLYQEAKVSEYWIADYTNKTLIIYHLENDKYVGSKIYTVSEIAKSQHFKGLEVKIDDVFEG
ncbi:MAG: Uma2 family endonuclease [Bacteroidia bacterium]